jgi:hypothetical protein
MNEVNLRRTNKIDTCINLLTGGLLVRIQPEEPIASTTYGRFRCRPILRILNNLISFCGATRHHGATSLADFLEKTARSRFGVGLNPDEHPVLLEIQRVRIPTVLTLADRRIGGPLREVA